MTFVVFSESKRIEKLRYMAGWPTCPRVVFNASESRVPASEKLGPPRGGPSFLIADRWSV